MAFCRHPAATTRYFAVPPDPAMFHLCGRPDETRHIVVRNEQAVVGPSESIHSGAGTHAYTLIWGMVGENQVFDDIRRAVSMHQHPRDRAHARAASSEPPARWAAWTSR